MYVENGATCLSVLTEEKHFLGKLEHIQDIKKKFKIPILAKDFFIDPYQVPLAKSFGSDCILIIIAALNGSQADEIYSEALKHFHRTLKILNATGQEWEEYYDDDSSAVVSKMYFAKPIVNIYSLTRSFFHALRSTVLV